jgi:ATP-dependent DNA ligase
MRNVKRTIRASAKDVISDLAPPPQWIEPELCKLVTKIPAGDGWAHEIKFDGFRMHARIVNGRAALLTRNGLDWTAKYPDIAAAIGALNCRQAYLDGELCAVLPDGTTSFSALQGHADTPGELVYFAFDLLHLDGEDLTRLPLLERKARLEALLSGAPAVIHFSSHVTLMLQEVLAQPHWQSRLTENDFRALTPLMWEHVNPYGRFELDMSTRLPLK